MSAPIYLDYAATTPVDRRVAEKMMQYLTIDGVFGNPASRSHKFGWQAEEAVDEARHCVAELIHADPREIVWTSGATESDNLAIKGAAWANRERGKHIITLCTEHKAVLDTCAELELQGFEVSYLPVAENGVLDLNVLRSAIRKDTILVSVMQVNNETGVIQDIGAIAQICREHDVLIHVDGAQSVGKIPVNVAELGIDLLSISGHKMYGPKGIGALYVRRNPRVKVLAQIHGGGHERGMRSGTLATHQIVGLGEAASLAGEVMQSDMARLTPLRDQLWQALQALGGVTVNGDLSEGLGSILNVSFADVAGEMLLMSLSDIAVSSGSACNSATVDPSFVLTAMGVERERALASVRLSLGRHTTAEQISQVIELFNCTIPQLRSTKPLWRV
ncbi:IscS subfamily cysteine desulfurase [Aliidiomarina celeris]|uniref:IscS subfamily cysteine desulfurase n=1 Tax=Aliidiomarina celeris TaxID=2249428 RepID=UPI000DEB6234|nr:IscS subfamily cysteine desulfurase [Aliidiomarina celeris]